LKDNDESPEAKTRKDDDYIQMALDEAAKTANSEFKIDSEVKAPETAPEPQEGAAQAKKAAGAGLEPQSETAEAKKTATAGPEPQSGTAEAKKAAGAKPEQQGNSGKEKEEEPFEDKVNANAVVAEIGKDKATIGAALNAAQKEYNEEKEKISDAKTQKAKEKADKYNVDAQIKKALEPLDAERERIEELKKKYNGGEMEKRYDEELQKIDAKKVELALQTQKSVEEAKKAKDERRKEKEERKKAEQLNAARAEAEAAIKEAAEQDTTGTGNANKQPSDPNSQSGEQDSEESSTETAGNNLMEEWFESITPEHVKYRGSSRRLSIYDDDDDDDDDGTEKMDPEEAKKRKKNFKKSKTAIQKIRKVDDMSGVMNLYIKELKSMIPNDIDDEESNSVLKRLKRRHKNKESRNHNKQIINELEKNLKHNFEFHSVPLKRLEQKLSDDQYSDWEPGIPYVMELSTLLDDLHKSLKYAHVKLLNEHSDQSEELANNIGIIMEDRLRAPLFRKLAKEFLLNQKINLRNSYGENVKDREGNDVKFNPFEHVIGNGGGYRGSLYPSINNSLEAITSGQCYMGALRTIINVCNAQTQLDPGASKVVKDFVGKCKNLVGNAHTYDDKQIKNSVSDLQLTLSNGTMINTLTGGKAGNNQSKNGKKISAIMDLLGKFAKDTSDKKVIQEIQKKLKEFNNFSDLGINAGDVSQYVRKLYEPTSDYEYVPEA